MAWAWKIATFRGIAVYIHATFTLLLGWVLFSYLLRGQSAGTALTGVLFVVLLFACVVLHEFGHALTAQRFGVPTRDITLYPIGGIARLERIPRDPRQELAIAVAGPAVNVVIALALGLYLAATHAFMGFTGVEIVGGSLVRKLMWVNVSLVLFNLLPAFPMDGGRVLRALLATRMEYGRATQTAARIGQGMAFLFGFVGLLFNPLLLFVAFFVYLGAGQEAQMVQAELAFRGVPVREAMMTQFASLAPSDTLSRAAARLLEGSQHDFPVVADGAVIGVLTRTALIEGLSRGGPGISVTEAMHPAPAAVSAGDRLEDTFQQMRAGGTEALPVVDAGRLVGLLTLENIGELLMLRTAVATQRGQEAAERPEVGDAWEDNAARPVPTGRDRGPLPG